MTIETEELLARANALVDRLRRHRRTLHREPELAWAEHRTAEYIESVLDELDIPNRRIVGTGVVGVIAGQGDGPGVGVRADMDALPVAEAPGRSGYRSEVAGVSHACGHDAHVAIVLGVAELLCASPPLPGPVALYFQPAEETTGGAAPMVEAGVLDDPPVRAVLATHVSTRHPSGCVAIATGPVTASTDTVTITVHGVGGHAAHPHHAVDPVPIAAEIVLSLQRLVSREVSPTRAAVITVGTIRGGSASNVIAPSVELGITVRALHADVRERLLARIEEVASQIAVAHRATAGVAVERGYGPGFNDPALTEEVHAAATAVVGADRVVLDQPSMGAEDFFDFGSTGLPVSMFRLGVANADLGITAGHHSPEFDLDEDALPVGVAVLMATIRRLLG